MSFPFDIKPMHWWDRINPFWYRKRRVIRAVIEYQWSKEGMDKKLQEAVKNAVLYGEGRIDFEKEAGE